MVIQDVRGKFLSEGKFQDVRPFNPDKKGNDFDEASDSYDTIDWLVKNIPNNNASVGVFGVSYPGFYTTMAALSGHPARLRIRLLLTHSGHLPALRKARHCAGEIRCFLVHRIYAPLGLSSMRSRRARIFGHRRTNLRALSHACFSVLRQGSREFSDERLHEERIARRRNVHLHPKRFKL